MMMVTRKNFRYTYVFRILSVIVISCAILASMTLVTACDKNTVEKTIEQKPYQEGKPITGDMQKVASAFGYELSVNPQNGEFEVVLANSSKKWLSNPLGRKDDKVARDIWKTNMNSQMIISYTNKSVTTNDQANTFAGSSKGGGLKIYECENGYIAVYYFNSLKISIPLKIVLTKDGFDATVLMDKITGDKNTYYITGILLLPFLGAANENDTGYMMVPDGSGALINLNNKKIATGAYTGKIYGADASYKPTTKFSNQKNSSLPVFGIKTGNDALFGIITSGDALASINANVSGSRTGYNFIYPDFTIRAKDSFFIPDRSGKNRENTIMDKESIKISKLSVKYYILKDSEADYSGMARKYRQYLQTEKGMKKENNATNAVYLDIYNGVLKTQSKFGIPVKSTKVLTSYKQTQTIVDSFKEAGIESFVLRLRNSSSADINKKVSERFEINSNLGSKADYEALVKSVGIGRVYTAIDPINVKSNGWIIKTLNTTAQTVMGIPAYQIQYDLATGFKVTDNRWNLLSPVFATKYFEKYVKSAVSTDYGKYIALEEIGSKLYSDYGKNWSDLETTKNHWENSLKKAHDSGAAFLMDGGNAYTLPYAQRLAGIPSSSSGFVIVDEEIPFMQLSLNGIIEYSTQPVNLSSNAKRAFLKAIESDSCLSYAFIEEDPVFLRDTELSWLYGANYRVWKDDVVNNNKRYTQFKETTQNSSILKHSIIENGLVQVTYENGAQVLINYTNKSKTFNGISIPEMDFVSFRKAG